MAKPEQLSSNWMVIGGAGFFGIHMCAFLAKCGYRVISYDIASFPPHERPEGVEEVVGDIRDTGKLRESLHGVQYVIHAAAALTLSNPAEIEAVNAEGTRLVLTCCADVGVKRLIYIGTTAVYGMPRYHPIYEDAPLDPMGPYGIAKAKGEQYCLRAENLETVLIRPKSFIGTGRLGIFQILFDWIETGKRIYVLGDGNNRFQLLEVEDLCEAVHKAMLRGRNRQIYNLGAAQFGTVNEDLGALLAHASSGSRLVHVPARPAKAILAMLEALRISPMSRWVYDTADQDSYVSIEKAQHELNWQPSCSNRDALIRAYDWYLKEGKQLAQRTGTSHRVAWKQGILRILKALS